MIVGIDEVGRGCWAGPLVVGAVILDGAKIAGLTDSKKLTPKQREVIAHDIRRKAKAIGLGWVSAAHVDARGLSWALKQAARQALTALDASFKEIIIDGTIKLVDDPRVTLMKKADLLVPSVSAASVIAKVARDAYMKQVAKAFPHHGFDRHVGYGTQGHQEALRRHGVTPLHRMTFAPLVERTELFKPVSTIERTVGRQAELQAAAFLRNQGFKVLAANWRTRWCEIDLIARKASTIYFVEVKYRSSDAAGSGVEAVTAQKLRQMRFAAELWLQENGLTAENYSLSALSLSGAPIEVAAWLPEV
ncbi:MAG TPA: ribonuclease HII [Verrucomicrobiae bacterium]|nr:ribonuclease HII [Verrucomicrobiae bacterium]